MYMVGDGEVESNLTPREAGWVAGTRTLPGAAARGRGGSSCDPETSALAPERWFLAHTACLCARVRSASASCCRPPADGEGSVGDFSDLLGEGRELDSKAPAPDSSAQKRPIG